MLVSEIPHLVFVHVHMSCGWVPKKGGISLANEQEGCSMRHQHRRQPEFDQFVIATPSYINTRGYLRKEV